MDAKILETVNSTLAQMHYLYNVAYDKIPGGSVIIRYVQNSYQNDPVRIVLELFLVIFAFKYLMSKKYAPDRHELDLTRQEIDELVDEWQPDSLVPPLTPFQKMDLDSVPVIVGSTGARVKLEDGKEYLNLATYDFLGMANNPKVSLVAINALRKHGVGACGPPGFYGTIDAHLDLEKELARFIGTDEAIIYSQAFSAVSSVIPAFSKRGDILICDESIDFALQKGVQISRSNVKYYKHNDMKDLERVLDLVVKEYKKKNKPLNRRFIVFEGLSQNEGDIAPLPEILRLKSKYKFRLIADESISFGVLGKRGAGITDYFGVDPREVDIIISSMANCLGSSGGFCAGSHEVIDHQRLSGVAYCFSAALPAMLARSAIESLHVLEEAPEILDKLRKNVETFRNIICSKARDFEVLGDVESPLLHLRFRAPVDSREKEELLLQAVVQFAARDSVLITRSKFVWDQEMKLSRPSIRVCISAQHTAREMERAAAAIQKAFKQVSRQ